MPKQKICQRAITCISGCLLALNLSAASLNTATTETGSSSFSTAYHAAAKHDPELRAARLDLKAEEQEAPLAFGRLLPNINLKAGYNYEDSENYFTENPTNTEDPRTGGKIHEHYWAVYLDQPLFNWSEIKAYQAVKQGIQAARVRYTRAEQELILRVTETYLKLLSAGRKEYLYQQQLQTTRLQLEQALRQQDLGIGSNITLLEIQAQQDLVKTDLLEVNSQYEDARTQLENMTGETFEIPEQWKKSNRQPLPSSLSNDLEYWTNLVQNNLAFQEVQARIRQAELSPASSRAQHLPTLNLNLNYTDRNSDDYYRTEESFYIGVDFTLPIYQGGRSQASLHQADARMQSEMAKGDLALAQAQQEIKLMFAKVTSLAQRLEALKQSEASTLAYLEAATRGQQLNLRSNIDVLDARSQLLDVQVRYAESLQSYLQADLRLRHAVGTLTHERLNHFDQLFNEAAESAEYTAMAPNLGQSH